ncbi:MAG: hypothetical protein A3H70_00915 [Candidatus Komeilibacteria bacterium RIFCSPLOWO2_02_FULL_48_11]|uniref:Uncharacterized protein n=1 Tax=Candidatus Komeilibacteria bacterium RIFCSPLOWO2_02_FULL_48_11 TaxID=1798553 RepID=A0A1G2BVE6_9BACT|nr:MAG: hypothetical protein A3H70_00915 [Candidatus Komeilibacteria bacterium RIFCSPLOWO2_02_FULL_48_11]
MKKISPNNSSQLWLWVTASALVIVILWATVFYPASLKKVSRSSQQQFSEFRNKINDAFTIFKKRQPTETENSNPNAEIQDLRERVFGDSIKRPESTNPSE